MEGVRIRNGLYGFEFREVDRRRVESGDRKTYEAKQFWQRHHEMVNLAAKGYKQVAIAEILNVDPQTVSNTLNSRMGMEKISEIRLERDEEAKKISEKIRVLTNKALAVYHEIFDDESGECGLKDKMKVADTVVLELSGLRVPTRIQSHSVHATLTLDEIAEFKKRGIAAAKEAGLVISVEPIQIEQGGNGNGNGEGK
jgi:predicted transcriptional regulator